MYYYLQVGISIIFVIIFFASLIYLLLLSVKVATRLIERREAMRKSFVTSFIGWVSIFIVYFIWQDLSNWDLRTWIMVIVLITGFSTFTASLSALALWNWKNKT